MVLVYYTFSSIRRQSMLRRRLLRLKSRTSHDWIKRTTIVGESILPSKASSVWNMRGDFHLFSKYLGALSALVFLREIRNNLDCSEDNWFYSRGNMTLIVLKTELRSLGNLIHASLKKETRLMI